MISWLYWFFWTTRRCKHVPSEWRMREAGMGKIKHCKLCGKCTDLI